MNLRDIKKGHQEWLVSVFNETGRCEASCFIVHLLSGEVILLVI